MGIPNAEDRVDELSALVNCQLQLIRSLEQSGNDLTSAKIVFDSLRVSLFLATQDLHRARCHNAAQDMGDTLSGGEAKDDLVVVPKRGRTRLIGAKPLMPVGEGEDHIYKLGTEDSAEGLDNLMNASETELERKNGSLEHFEFRPLTDEEKKDFVKSLSAEEKRTLVGKPTKTRSGESAA